MAKKIALMIIFIAQPITGGRLPLLIVWNVGQGQWITWVTESYCLHFDMGGEKPPSKSSLIDCYGKKNEIYLSHGDWDHLSFIKNQKRKLQFCLHNWPREKISSTKKRILKQVKSCQYYRPEVVELTHNLSVVDLQSANDKSFVFIINNRILITGDSTKLAEKHWLAKLSQPIQVLILGHHGSNTSTSLELIAKLDKKALVIASARFKKYKHPHWKVLRRLQANGHNVLRTEHWGHIKVH